MQIFLFALLFLAVLGAGYWLWARRVEADIREGAALEWEALEKSDPELIQGYDRLRFAAVYRRVHFPRFPGYALAALAVFLLSTPLTFALISGSLWLGGRLGVLPEPVEVAKHIPIGEARAVPVGGCTADCQLYLAQSFAGFYFFFAIIAVWLLIFAFFMHRYHARRPGYLREELILNRPSV